MKSRYMPLSRTIAVVLSAMCIHGASATIVRETPAEIVDSTTGGLVRVDDNRQAGTIVAYAAEPGRVAYDGPDGGHSPFATALLRYLEAPLDVGLMLRWVRDAVLESTSGDQKPMAHVDLPGRSVYLAANPASPPSTRQPQERAEQEEPPTRIALTVGISAYEHTNTLKSPLNDAAEIASSLERLGFLVVRLENTDKATLLSALREFHDKASSAEVAVVFFSGHGFQYDGDHYLMPVDAQLNYREDIAAAGVPLRSVMNVLEPASVLRLILVDAMVDPMFATDSTK